MRKVVRIKIITMGNAEVGKVLLLVNNFNAVNIQYF